MSWYGLPFHHHFRREDPLAGELAEARMALASEQGFPYLGGIWGE